MTRLARLRWQSVLVAAVLVAAAVAIGPFAVAQDATKTFIMHPAPKPVGTISFVDGQGQTRSLSDFNGKVVVLNVWATWCVPCRTEMPTLDRLQAALGGTDFAVVPVSIDRGGLDIVGKFYAEISVAHLAKYTDTSGQILRSVGAVGLPTTLIIDRAGNELGRIVGPAEWDAPEVVTLLRSVMARPIDASRPAPENSTAARKDTPNLLSRSVQWLKSLIK